MRHDWIFDVLADLHSYADRNGLPELKQKIEETLVLAEIEIDAAAASDDTEGNLRFRSARRAH